MRTAIALSIALLFVSCGRSKDDKVVRRDGNPDYILVDENEEAKMDAAIARAKKEVDTFVSALQNPKPTQTYFSVKKPFAWQDGKDTNHEHIWISDVRFKDGRFHGRVGNEPVDVKNVKIGDEVTLEKSEASDWMIIDDGYLIGGYTIIALRDAMPDNERKEFDSSFPFKIRTE